MGLKDLFNRWTKSRDAEAVARAEDEARMTPHERAVDQEDYEARKDDVRIRESFAGSAAEDLAESDLDR